MIEKTVKILKNKKVEVFIYKNHALDIQAVSLEPYQIKKIKKDWRKIEYQVLDGDVIVHTSTVFKLSPTLFHLKLQGILIGNCYTNPNYRGQSIYPRMLHHIILNQNVIKKEKSIFVFVSPNNASSIAGIEKAGFKKCHYLKAKKWLCFFYDEKIIKF